MVSTHLETLPGAAPRTVRADADADRCPACQGLYHGREAHHDAGLARATAEAYEAAGDALMARFWRSNADLIDAKRRRRRSARSVSLCGRIMRRALAAGRALSSVRTTEEE